MIQNICLTPGSMAVTIFPDMTIEWDWVRLMLSKLLWDWFITCEPFSFAQALLLLSHTSFVDISVICSEYQFSCMFWLFAKTNVHDITKYQLNTFFLLLIYFFRLHGEYQLVYCGKWVYGYPFIVSQLPVHNRTTSCNFKSLLLT